MRISIAKRLYLGFTLIVGIGVASMLLAMSQSARVDQVLKKDVSTVRASQNAALFVARAGTSAARFVDVPKDAAAQDVLANLAMASEQLRQLAGGELEGPTVAMAKEAEQQLAEVKAGFGSLVAAYREKGFTETEGAMGRLRAAVHAVEKTVTELKQKDLTILMLMCRRHEKDFMLRWESKYLDQTLTRAGEFKAAAAKLELPSETLAGLVKQMDDYVVGMTEFVAARKRIESANSAYAASSEKVTSSTKALAEHAEASVTQGIAKIHEDLSSQKRSLTAASVLLVVLGPSIAFVFARAILKRINAMRDCLTGMAVGGGDLTKRLPEDTGDEFEQTARPFNLFMEKVRDTMCTVVQSASEVAASSTEIAANSEHLLAGVRQQHLKSQQVAAAVEESSSSVSQVAERTEQATGLARKAGEQAASGGREVSGTVNAVEELSHQVAAVAKTIESLGKRSEEIGQIITVINEIADQTNLLALNAAIEAARAGEHGRGFSVVADEVRKLAERTTQATNQVGESIKAIQSETASAVSRMKSSSEQVQGGVEQARRAGGMITQIVSSADEVANVVSSIAASAREQTQASDEISAAVGEISAVANEFTARSEQTAQATARLSSRAESLRTLIAGFKTERRGIGARVRGDDVTCDLGKVIDISSGGMQLELPAGKKLGPKECVATLGRGGKSVSVHVEQRWAKSIGGAWHVGVEFTTKPAELGAIVGTSALGEKALAAKH